MNDKDPQDNDLSIEQQLQIQYLQNLFRIAATSEADSIVVKMEGGAVKSFTLGYNPKTEP